MIFCVRPAAGSGAMDAHGRRQPERLFYDKMLKNSILMQDYDRLDKICK